jgi:hypothetical protein
MTPNAEQVKTAVLYLLAASGPLYQLLIQKGLTPDQIGSIQNLAITFGPLLVAGTIGVARRTHAAIIAATARILAGKGQIIVSPSAGDGAAKVAADPNVPNVKLGTLSSHWLVGLLATGALLLSLPACSSSTNQAGPSPTAQVYAAKVGYEAALVAAVKYNNLPRCGLPSASPLCSDVSAIAEIRKAANSAKAALDAAEATVRTPGASSDARTLIVAGAVNSVAALQAVLVNYGVK